VYVVELENNIKKGISSVNFQHDYYMLAQILSCVIQYYNAKIFFRMLCLRWECYTYMQLNFGIQILLNHYLSKKYKQIKNY
jgi:hypothetical protein